MENIQDILDQIPIRHDFASYIMFLGIVLGYLLSVVIFLRSNQKNTAFTFLGIFLITQATIALDNFLCYTGLMKYTIAFNDASEPLVLILGPSLYLFGYSLLTRKPITIKNHGFHILPSLLYCITQIRYYLHPQSIKLNAYLNAYFPELKKAPFPEFTNFDYLWIKDEFRWLILFSFIIYIVVSFRILYHYINKTKTSIDRKNYHNKYTFTRNLVILFLVIFLIIFAVYWNFENDLGDHYITVFVNLTVIAITLIMVSESRFFQNSWIADKYETSNIKSINITIQDIRNYVQKEDYFLAKDASLKNLSEKLKVTPHYISQIINEETKLNFNDFINQYRIDASKKRLTDPGYNHLTIEAIGNSVGFKSKSAFYSAFKKHVAMSPKAFITLQQSGA